MTGTRSDKGAHAAAIPTRRDLVRLLWWWVVLAPAEALVRLTHRPTAPQTGKTKVLLVRLDALGDFVLWLDSALGLRKHFDPERHEITLVCTRSSAPLALRSGCFDHVWPLDRRRFAIDPFSRYRFLKRLRSATFSVAVNTTYSRDFLWGDAVAHCSGAPRRIGYQGETGIVSAWLMRMTDRWYTQILPARAGWVHELVRNADFVRELGNPDFLASVPEIAAAKDTDFANQPGTYYLLVPAAGKKYRCWPPDRFAEIARRIHAATGLTGRVAGSHDDAAVGEALCATANVPIENWAGRTSLDELVALIAGARLIVSNETGAVHIAAAVGTPAVSITGGGHYGRFVPYAPETPTDRPLPVVATEPMPCFGCNWNCVFDVPRDQPKPCLTAISVETVWAMTASVLNESSDPSPARGPD